MTSCSTSVWARLRSSCLLGLIFVGPKKLPDLASGLATLVRARPIAPDASRWSWSDWLLVCAALASGATALLFGFQR